MLDAPCDNIKITKWKKTLGIYEHYWKQIMDLIGKKIRSIIE